VEGMYRELSNAFLVQIHYIPIIVNGSIRLQLFIDLQIN
jgi:hypothetical protein